MYIYIYIYIYIHKITFRSTNYQSPPETYRQKKHPQYESRTHGITKSIFAEKPRRKKSNKHYCTRYSKTR